MCKDTNCLITYLNLRKDGFERAFGKEGAADTAITKIGIAFHDDGTTSFFAELEKSSAK